MRKYFRAGWLIISAPFRLILWIIIKISKSINNLYNETRSLFTTEVEDESLPDTVAKTIENPMGLMEHIDALRKNLLRSVVFLIITTSISFTFTKQIIDFLAKPVGGLSALRAIDVTEPISVFMRVALLSGFALALPYIAFELWIFAAPGLKRKTRIVSLISIPIATVLFFSGMAFAYYLMLPVGVPFLISVLGIPAELRPSTYVRFVTGVMFWLGAAFELPLVVYILALAGFIKAKFLKEQWRLAIVIIAIIAAAITPTVDPINMSIVMGPLIILYFLSIGLAYLAQRSRTQTNTVK
jgi:sec-independent protein translocase protein TatC